MNQLSNARKVLAYLEFHGFESLEDLTISFQSYGIEINAEYDRLTEEEIRNFKRVFGPMKIDDGYGQKNLKGTVEIDKNTRIEAKLNRAYTCEQITNPEELTEEKWAEIREHARAGRIKLQDCKAVNAKDQTETTTEEESF